MRDAICCRPASRKGRKSLSQTKDQINVTVTFGEKARRVDGEKVPAEIRGHRSADRGLGGACNAMRRNQD